MTALRSVLLLLCSWNALVAIGYDGNAQYLGASSSASTTYTGFVVGSGANRLIIIGTTQTSGGDVVTGITYAGIPLAQLGMAWHSGSRANLWYLLAPATGANNIVITATAGTLFRVYAASYSGVSQTGFPDASVLDTTSNAAGGDPGIYTTNITTIADNAWIIEIASMGGSWNGTGGNSTIITTVAEGMVCHRGPVTPGGSTTISTSTTYSGGNAIASISAAFAPDGASPGVASLRRFYGQ